MKKILTQAKRIAVFDLSTSVRTKKAFVALILYVGLALLVAAVAVFFQNKLLEDPTAKNAISSVKDQLLAPITAALGGDSQMASYLLTIPPVMIIFFWMTQTFLPLLVAVISADILNGEIRTGSARFMLLRTSRTSLVAGKSISHAVLFVSATVLSYVAFIAYVMANLKGFDLGATFPTIMKFMLTTLVLGACYLGLTAAVSAFIDSGAVATLVTFVILIAFSGLAHSEYFGAFSPSNYRYDLWSPRIPDILKGLGAYVGFAAVFFGLAWYRFTRRDL